MANGQPGQPGRNPGLLVGLLMALTSAGIGSIDSDPAAPGAPGVAVGGGGEPALEDDEDLLAELEVELEGPRTGYKRSSFRHWVDEDADGCDARQEVLIAESLVPVELQDGDCPVQSGRWFSEFDGVEETVPRRLDVDHLVPLAEAWDSGAADWDPQQRREFANNLEQTEALIAVSASSNRSKGDKDPAEWLPPREEYRCTYVRDWITVKVSWELSADPNEVEALRLVLEGCG